jgi:WD40 repeat protein
VSGSSPYRGLAPFEDTEHDALYFFGRERDTEIVVANLIASRLTVLYGPSGVGKSSLLFATVARALRALPEAPLVVVFSSWGRDPARELATVMADLAGIDADGLVDTVERIQVQRDVYLILDQAEEYFTYHESPGELEASLAAIINRPLRVNALLSLREDTLATLDRLKAEIPGIYANVLRLDRLDRTAGRAAIVGPLDRWSELEQDDVVAEDALVERVLDGVGVGRIELGPGGVGGVEGNGDRRGIEAPYLQLVMQRIWEVEQAAGSSTLRAATLEQLGGAGQVVSDHLERAIDALAPAQQEIAARLFDHLVTPSGTKIAHETPDLAAFAGASAADVSPVLETLAGHRILRTDENGRWEIFHDVLAGAVLGWKSRYDAERAVERARAEARQRHRRLGFLAIGALVALVAATTLAAFAFSQRSEARDQARVAKGGQLVASSLSQLDSDPELALALAVEAARVDPIPPAEEALREALAASRERAIVDVGHPLVSLELDRAGSRALVVGLDGIARLIRLPAGEEAWSHRVDGAAAAFSPDSKAVHLVDRRSLLVLDAATGAAVGQPIRLVVGGDVERLVVSPDGETAVVIAGKPRARVVSLRTGAIVGRVKQSTKVTAAAFGPSGRVVASGGVDRTARLWDPRTWEMTRALRGHVGHVLAVSFDRTGALVATGSSDQTARLWRVGTGVLDTVLYGHTGSIRDVSFGASREVVTASGDGTARTWGANGRPLQTLRGHRGAVTAATFAADGSVVTAGADGTIRVWDPGTSIELRPTHAVGPTSPATTARSRTGAVATASGSAVRLRSTEGVRVLRGHQDLVNALSFSPDGRLLVTAGRDHDVIVWDVASGEPVHRFPEAHSASVSDARFSPDGRWIVTAGPISARLWDVAAGRPLGYLYGPKSALVAAAFASDSRTVVSQEEDGTVRRYVCELCGGIDELTALARSRLGGTGRSLTADERARYLG